MSSPLISFRLTPYQLARSIKIVRTLEPEYKITSMSQLVKTLVIDYLSKTSLQNIPDISPADIMEIHTLISTKTSRLNLTSFKEQIRPKKQKSNPNQKSAKPIDSSIITSVSDFSPPKDWK